MNKKPITRSKTAHGALVALLVGGLSLAGVDVEATALDEVAQAMVLILSFAYTIYGRLSAVDSIDGFR